MRWFALLGLLAALSACTAPKKPVTAASDDLSVASVTIYASGVAFLEHRGKVTDDATFNLRGKPSDIPGILKSLVIHDQADSRPVVALPSSDKAENSSEKSSDKTDKPSDKAAGDEKASSEPKTRTLAVQLKGKGERDVRIGYAMEAKPWKVTYRLMLGETPSLQAWATISNDTDYEWKKIQLNLISGRPLVLAADGATDAAAASRASKGAGATAGESLLRPRLIPSRQALDLPPDAVQPPIPLETAPPEALPAGAPLVNPREVFRYTVSAMTIPRRGSVVVPVLGDAVEVERVSVYNERVLGRNPLQGARIRNTTSRYLLQGSVSVQEEGEFVGDASMENLAPGRKGLVTWGIDLPVQVDSTHESLRTSVKSARVEKGVLHLTRNYLYARRYTVDNEDQKDRTLIIEHPMRRGWTLVDTAGLLESTETLHRFRLIAAAGKRTSLLVKEQTPEAEDIDLALADADSILTLSRDTNIAPAVREALAKSAAEKERLAEQERQIRTRQADLDRVVSEQARTRQALQTLPDQSPARARLQEKLDKSDAQVADLTKAIDQAQDELDKAAAEVRANLSKLDAGQ